MGYYILKVSFETQKMSKGGGKVLYPELLKMLAYKGMTKKDLAKVLGITPQLMGGKTDFKRNEMQIVKEHFQDICPDITMDQIFERNIFLP